MVCACLVCKIYGYYNKGVYVQLIRSTTKAATHSCMKSIYPKIKLHKNTRNHTNLIKRTSQLHERQDRFCVPGVNTSDCRQNIMHQ